MASIFFVLVTTDFYRCNGHTSAELMDTQTLITTVEAFDSLIAELYLHDRIGWDTEFSSLHHYSATIIGSSFAYKDSTGVHSFYIPLNHVKKVGFTFQLVAQGEEPMHDILEKLDDQIPTEYFVQKVWTLFQQKGKEWCGSNIGGDIKLLFHYFKRENLKISFLGRILDTILSAFQMDMQVKNLKDRTKIDLGYTMRHFNEVCPDPSKVAFVPIPTMLPYAADDAKYSLLLASKHEQMLAVSSPAKLKMWKELEGMVALCIAHMEFEGILCDGKKLEELDSEFVTAADRLEQEIFALLGKSINLGSTKQLSFTMFDELKLWDAKRLERKLNLKQRVFFRGEPTKNHPKGTYSSSKDILADILYYRAGTKMGLKIAELLLEYRSYDTLRSTFTRGLQELTDDDGKIRTQFKQAFVRTGRLSSAQPNLQNIPSQGIGRRIREAFIPEKGWVILDPDFSQMELRVLAHVSRDPQLLAVFTNGLDPHQTTADALGVDRRTGKTVGFGVVYGQGAAKLSRQLHIPHKTAKKHIDGYMDFYEHVKKHRKATVKFVRENGYVQTLFGATRSFEEEITSGKYWENAAMNTTIQGPAAIIMKIAMRNVLQWLIDEDLLYSNVKMHLQVHDELVMSVRAEKLEYVKAKVKQLMQDAVKLPTVEFLVETDSGPTWADAH